MTTTKKVWIAVAVGAAILGQAQPSKADPAYQRVIASVTDTMRTAVDMLPSDITNVRIGFGPGISTDYEGGKHYHVRAIPVISLRFRDLVEINNNEIDVIAFDRLFDAGTTLGDNSRLKIGPLVSIDFGRSPGDAPELKGTAKIKTSFEFGAFATYEIGATRVRAAARQDVANGHRGMTLDMSVGRTLLRGDDFSLGGSVYGTWVNGNYMRSFFGVKAAAVAASTQGLKVYQPTSGFKNFGAGLNANYLFSDHWSLVATADYQRLVGKAADSPLVATIGSANQFNATTFVIYTF